MSYRICSRSHGLSVQYLAQVGVIILNLCHGGVSADVRNVFASYNSTTTNFSQIQSDFENRLERKMKLVHYYYPFKKYVASEFFFLCLLYKCYVT